MPIRLNVARLRAAAKAHGCTNDTQISLRTGVSPATISKLSKPEAALNPRVETFRALGRPFDLTVDDLILDDEADSESVAA